MAGDTRAPDSAKAWGHFLQSCVDTIDGAQEWNRLRRCWRDTTPVLNGVHISGHNLDGFNFARAQLTHCSLSHTSVRKCSFEHAVFESVHLEWLQGQDTIFDSAKMTGTTCEMCAFPGARFRSAQLSNANFRGSNLFFADFSQSDLSGSRLDNTMLPMSRFDRTRLSGTTFWSAKLGATTFIAADLSAAVGLETCSHSVPSSLDTHTLAMARRRLPLAFLRGCGLSRWEIEVAKLYDLTLGLNEFSDQLYRISEARNTRPIGGIFISYSRADERFVNALHEALGEKDFGVWRDVHDLIAGPMITQLADAIRRNDVVLLVLSKASLESDWVSFEIERAREREKLESRDILCPIALDDEWKIHQSRNVAISQLARAKNILRFDRDTGLQSSANASTFDKLLRGITLYYRRKDPSSGPTT